MLKGSKFVYRYCTRTIAIAIAANAAVTGAGAQEASDPSAAQVEDIVVTARRSEESLQKVPVSVSALGAGELASRSVDSLSAVSQSTPNFTFSQQPQGGAASSVVFIRGVGQGDTLSVFDPAVGIYLDGIYYGRMQATDLDILEVERLEVLRGPQGTLFGKNTSGGAINIVTKAPDPSELSGRIRVTTGSRDRFDALASVNLPLIEDKLALQLSGSRRKQDGYGRRILTGEEMNGKDRWAGRAQLLIQPTDNFSIVLSGDVTDFDESNSTFQLVAVNTAAAPIAALNALTPTPYDNRWVSPSPYDTYATGGNSSRGTLWGASATMALETDWATLKSITAYRDNRIFSEIDPDASPITILDSTQRVDQNQFSQEFQASGKGFDNRLNWVAGIYFFHEKAIDDIRYNLLTPLFQGAADFTQGLTVTNDSFAGYGQGTFSVTDKLRITAGLRFTIDDKQVTRRKLGAAFTPVQPTITQNRTSTAVSPRFGIDYQWSPSLMTYASVAQGYKSGGFNGRASTVDDFNEFEDETVWTYEVGLRSDLFDRRVRFNVTGFYSDYSDLQLPTNGSQVIDGRPVSFAIVSNIPKSRIMGGESELTIVPVTGLTLSGSLGLTYTKYKELPTTPRFVAAGIITTDSVFPFSPEVAYNLSAQYEAPIVGDFNILLRADYAHKSEIFFNAQNTDALRQAPYGLLNARIALTHEPSGIQLALFGTNLTKKRYILGGYDDATTANPGLGFAIVNPGAPREWGLSLEFKF